MPQVMWSHIDPSGLHLENYPMGVNWRNLDFKGEHDDYRCEDGIS